ncbi:unnamed protein product [Schistosoma turkestanicum]|nr:unnamed protein product [Schistosoma turkestanicum]
MSIYLRIKRSNTDCPNEIYEAENLIKRSKAHRQSIQFKYIGSQTTSNCSLISKIDKICSSSDKSCKIICNTTDATVVDENQTIKCQVKVNNLKRPACIAGIFDDFTQLNITDSKKTSVVGPNPPKIFKIIELTPEPVNELNSSSETNTPNSSSVQSDCIYDIYKMISTTTSSLSSPSRSSSEQTTTATSTTIWCSNDQLTHDLLLIKNADNYIIDDDWESNDYYHTTTVDGVDDDDEDDSNSESNWRNDYPDEKECSSSSGSSGSSGRSSSRNSNSSSASSYSSSNGNRSWRRNDRYSDFYYY